MSKLNVTSSNISNSDGVSNLSSDLKTDFSSEEIPTKLPSPCLIFDVTIESLFTKEILVKLEKKFDGYPMNLSSFMRVVTDLLQLDPEYAKCKVPKLFYSIDSYQKGSVTFLNVCDHLSGEFELRNISTLRKEKVDLQVPAKIITTKANKLLPTKLFEIEGLNLLFSNDGVVSFWSGAFSLRKVKTLRTKDMEKEKISTKFYTDAKAIEALGKVIATTGDKELQFFELPNLEPYCQIINLPTVPQTLDCVFNNKNELIIVYGDWNGSVMVLSIANATSVLRMWNERQKVLGIPTMSLDLAYGRQQLSIARWKIHEGRVSVVRYTEVMGGQVISCSSDPKSSVVIGIAANTNRTQYSPGVYPMVRRPEGEEVAFATPYGIYCVDLWEDKRLFAAGGIDRVIRIWNTLTKRNVAVLQTYFSPIVGVSFYPPFVILLSISSTYNIRLWDLTNYQCMVLISGLVSQVKGQNFFFMGCSRVSHSLVVQTSDELYTLSFKKEDVDDEVVTSHTTPIIDGGYSELLESWITCSERSVKIWDVQTGKEKFKFLVKTVECDKNWGRLKEELRFFYEEAKKKRKEEESTGFYLETDKKKKKKKTRVRSRFYPDFENPGEITCMHIDKKGRRLLTGHTSGIIKEYNFFSGVKLRTMCRGMYNKEQVANNQINAVLFVRSTKNDNIVTVGWNKVVDLYETDVGAEPVSTWDCDSKGHTSDIYSAATTSPDVLATGSYDGLVILWNFTSGSLEASLRPPDFIEDNKSDMCKVTALTFYKLKESDETIFLLSAGPGSGMQMWEIYWRVKIIYYRGIIRPWRSEERYLTRLVSVPNRGLILGGDDLGDIHIFDMKSVEPKKGLRYNPRGYELNTHLKDQIPIHLKRIPIHNCGFSSVGMPIHIKSWASEAAGITALDFCEKYGLILCGSKNGMARIWNFKGQYIGTLGVGKPWDICDKKTYLQSKVPSEIKNNFRRVHEEKLDKICKGEMETIAAVEVKKENPDDYKLSHDEILEMSRGMPIYRRKLPPFLKYETRHKIVYKDFLGEQKFSLAPVYHREMDDNILVGLEKGIQHCGK